MNLNKQSILKVINRCESLTIRVFVGLGIALLCVLFVRNVKISYLLFQIFKKEDLKYSIRLANYTIALSTGRWIFSDPTFVFVERFELIHIIEYSKLLEKMRPADDDLSYLTAALFLKAREIEQKQNEISEELKDFKRIANKILEPGADLLPCKINNVVTISNADKQTNFQDTAHEALSDWLKIFLPLKDKFFLVSGTFLGAVRLGDFLQHDYDIDLGIMAKDFNYKNFCDYIKKSDKLSVKNVAYIKEKKIEGRNYVTSSNKLGLIKVIHKTGINIDLFIHHEVDGVYLHGSSYHIWKNTKFELNNYKIGSICMKGPADYGRYLTENYGDWTTPKSNFNFITDTPNLTFVQNLISLSVKIKQQTFLNNDQVKIMLLKQVNDL